MPRQITIGSGQYNVELPNGGHYDAGAVVILSDDEFALVPSSAFTDSILIDGGDVSEGDLVTVQGTHVAQPASLTSAAPDAVGSSPPASLTSAAPDSPTSSQNSTTAAATQTSSYVQSDAETIAALANALQTSYNALQEDFVDDNATLALVQADVAALQTTLTAVQEGQVDDNATLAAVQADVAVLHTAVAAILTALTGSGKPMASS